MAKIINFTPHAITICDADGDIIITFPPGEADGIPLSRTVYGQPTGRPEMEPGTLYSVSQIIKAALPDRDDLLVTEEVVRDADGNFIGCRSLGE